MTEQLQEESLSEGGAAKNGRRRVITIAGIGAVVAALAASAYFFLGAADNQTIATGEVRSPVRTATSASVKPSASALPTPSAAVEPIRADPFKPLFSPKPTPKETVAPVAPVLIPTPTAVTTPIVQPTIAPTPIPTPSVVLDTVVLESVSAKAPATVTISINNVVLTGKVGDVLGKMVKIVTIRAAEGGATFQMGEATFDLHIGQAYAN